MSDELKILQNRMQVAFKIYADVPHIQLKVREEAWAQYVSAREHYLKVSAYSKRQTYVPLKETIQTDYVFGSYKKEVYGS